MRPATSALLLAMAVALTAGADAAKWDVAWNCYASKSDRNLAHHGPHSRPIWTLKGNHQDGTGEAHLVDIWPDAVATEFHLHDGYLLVWSWTLTLAEKGVEVQIFGIEPARIALHVYGHRRVHQTKRTYHCARLD